MGRPRTGREDRTVPFDPEDIATLRRLASASTRRGTMCSYGDLVRTAVKEYLARQLDGALFRHAGPQRFLPMVQCPPIGGRRGV